MTDRSWPITLLAVMIISLGIGIPVGLAFKRSFVPRYDRWTELSGQEILFVRDCVKAQKYLTCLENVYQMRQIGIAP